MNIKRLVSISLLVLVMIGAYTSYRFIYQPRIQEPDSIPSPPAEHENWTGRISDLSLLYTDYPFKSRLVSQETLMLQLPREGEEVFRAIPAHTVIKVENAVIVNSEQLWLYVHVNP